MGGMANLNNSIVRDADIETSTSADEPSLLCDASTR